MLAEAFSELWFINGDEQNLSFVVSFFADRLDPCMVEKMDLVSVKTRLVDGYQTGFRRTTCIRDSA